MNGEIRFFVEGDAATAGSKRAFPIRRKDGSIGVAVTDACKRKTAWMKAVAAEAAKAMGGKPLLDGPVRLTVAVYRKRPASHYDSKGNVKESVAGDEPTQKPDLLKHVRAIEDALTGVVWKDDSQVIRLEAVKLFAPTQQDVGVEVFVRKEEPS